MAKVRLGLVALSVMMGMLGASAEDLPSYPACVHPYPCGDEWPEGLQGPFALKSVEQVSIPSHDGILLHGWIGLPDVPDGVRVPVAATSTPYLANCPLAAAQPYCAGTPGEPGWWADPPTGTGIPPYPAFVESDLTGYLVAPIEIIKRGIAVAYFDVRGTGSSGGCFEFHANENERKDQRVLVEWLASQGWSNGRIALGGHSYAGMTAIEAAVERPPALKTIFASGYVVDPYLLGSTPQGASLTLVGALGPQATTDYTFDPRFRDAHVRWGPVQADASDGMVSDPNLVGPTTERCAASYIRQNRALEAPNLGIDRDAGFWNERRLLDRFSEITTSMLLQQGLLDTTVQPWQDDLVWAAASRAPRWLIQGQWVHCAPPGVDCDAARSDPDWEYDPSWNPSRWRDVILSWLDFWLWGKGDVPEHLGSVTYQEPSGTWHETSSWPPADAVAEVLYLGDTLSPEPPSRTVAAIMAPSGHTVTRVSESIAIARGGSFPSVLTESYPELCSTPTADVPRVGTGSMSAPLSRDIILAGEPLASLKIRSDQPSGAIAVHVVEIEPGFSCEAPEWNLVRQISAGAADLRFFRGNFFPIPVEPGVVMDVRVDLSSIVRRIPAGNRIAVVVGAPPQSRWGGVQTAYPTIELVADGAGSTHVVLPFVEGSLGGREPTLMYPPRPFSTPSS